MVSGPVHETAQARPATAIRIPVVLCGAPVVKPKSSPRRRRGLRGADISHTGGDLYGDVPLGTHSGTLLWGDCFQLSGGRNRVEQYMNNRGGQMIATSMEGAAQGRGSDTAILDDPT